MPDESLRVPTFCPMCHFVMKGSSSSYYRFQVCLNCFIEFIEDREERWKSGWRPSSEQFQSYLDRLKDS